MEEENKLEVIEQEVNNIVLLAKNMVVTNQEELEQVTKVTQEIKTQGKKVTEYWKTAKDSAYQTWKDLCAKEKENLKPLEEAEQILKSKLSVYFLEQDKIQKEKELELQKLQQIEFIKRQKEAEKLRAKGNEQGAEIVEAIANSIQTLETKVEPTINKVQGLSFKTSYSVEVIDDTKVPISLNEITLRPIDESAILKLAQASKGSIKIDGIKINEVKIPVIKS